MRATSVAAVLAIACIVSVSREAHAAPEFVERGITLPRHDWAFDFGLGIAHGPWFAPRNDATGAGINAEMSVAVISHLELGFRTGIRFGDEAKVVSADEYGRLYDRQTFATGGDLFANPEARIRGALIHGDVVELALEGRVVLPFEQGTRVGALFGMPLMFHIGHRVRLDTGVYTPVVFFDPIVTRFNAPIDVWIQCTPRLWLGPMSGISIFNPTGSGGRPNGRVDVSLGFGLGYQILRTLDLKTMFLIPRINEDNGIHSYGAGVGIQVRIE